MGALRWLGMAFTSSGTLSLPMTDLLAPVSITASPAHSSVIKITAGENWLEFSGTLGSESRVGVAAGVEVTACPCFLQHRDNAFCNTPLNW